QGIYKSLEHASEQRGLHYLTRIDRDSSRPQHPSERREHLIQGHDLLKGSFHRWVAPSLRDHCHRSGRVAHQSPQHSSKLEGLLPCSRGDPYIFACGEKLLEVRPYSRKIAVRVGLEKSLHHLELELSSHRSQRKRQLTS